MQRVSNKLPKGWIHSTIGGVCSLQNGTSFNEKSWSKNGIPIIRIQNLNGGEEYNYFAGPIEKCVLVNPGDLLFAWSGNRGTSFGPTIWKGAKGVLNQHIFKVIPKEDLQIEFLYHAFKQVTVTIEGRAHGGTGIVHVRKSELENFPLVIPPESQREKIVEILGAFDKTIEAQICATEQNRRLRNVVGEQLLNGRIALQ